MNRCPITYEFCDPKYSIRGLKLLSKRLKTLNAFPYTAKEQLQLASHMAVKLSIQGIQPKLSVVLNEKKEVFELVDKGGQFIIKPPHPPYDELPQNEDLTMRLALIADIDVPLHGLVYNIDGSLSYFIKRFDRVKKGDKVAVEDFSQLLGFSRETKYESSMEQVASVLEKHCTFPAVEKLKLFDRVIFNFLVGNEDMHLKNFSLIRPEGRVELSPAYDLLNSSIVLQTKEEIALPLKGKKSRLKRSDLLDYFGHERLGIEKALLENVLSKFEKVLPSWKALISQSFLSEKMQNDYWNLVQQRWKQLNS